MLQGQSRSELNRALALSIRDMNILRERLLRDMRKWRQKHRRTWYDMSEVEGYRRHAAGLHKETLREASARLS